MYTTLKVSFAIAVVAHCSLQAAEPETRPLVRKITRVAVFAGTLEFQVKPMPGYVFECDGVRKTFPIGSMKSPAGMLAAIQVGFKMTNGKVYSFVDTFDGERELMERALKENPGAKIESNVFRGTDGNDFIVLREGKTPIYRVGIDIGGIPEVYWLNR